VVTWDAKGQTALSFQEEPSKGGDQDCVAGGRETFAVTLAAGSGSDEVERRRELVQLQSSATEPVVLHTNSLEGNEVVARGHKNRSLTVQHAGRSAVIAQGTTSEALSGTSLAGPWELRSTLSDAELKTPSRRPKELGVLATLRCRK